MRRTLPIAIVLIAAGIALWAGKNGELNRIIRLLNGQFASKVRPTEPTGNNESHLLQTSSKVRTEDSHSLPKQLEFAVVESLQNVATTQNGEANKFLKNIGTQLRNSSPFKTDVHAKLTWNGAVYEIAGQYIQPGQQTNQFRVDLKIGKEDSLWMSKISDGRFLYSIKWLDGRKSLEFIDLRRIQETRAGSGLAHSDNPTQWIAAGGLASLFENLADAFGFSTPQMIVQNGKEYLRLDGTWSELGLVELLKGSVPHHYLEPHIVWRKLPPHIPHQVSLYLVQTENFGWMPYQVNFYRFTRQKEHSSGSVFATSNELDLLAGLRFAIPQSIDLNETDFLQLNTDGVEIIDNTPQYISQFRQFELSREASMTNSNSAASRLR